jgi:hypothetical protein
VRSFVRAVSTPIAVVFPHPGVDEWGRDARLVAALAPIARSRWTVDVQGAALVGDGAALIVISNRRLALAAVSAALALSEVLDRPVRFAGRPDVVPFGPALRRLGGILADPAEVAGALRSGDVVLVSAGATRSAHEAGAVDADLVGAATRTATPVHVAATASSPISRHASVQISSPLQQRRNRRGPLAEVELAEQARRQLQTLLDELGGNRLRPIATGSLS